VWVRYARHCCGAQPDQELFSVVHSGKEPPATFANEKGIVLLPIRMKPDHPSVALPKSARIHYGRAYQVDHDLPVQPLGQIHSTSIETLLDQFEANVFRGGTDSDPVSETIFRKTTPAQDENVDVEITAADMDIVRDKLRVSLE
jgi:hypothetical protein